MKFRNQPQFRRHGFSLVELLVVVSIVVVLVGILLPVVSGAQRSARDVQCASNIRQLCAGLIMYAAEWKGKFPPNSIEYDPKPVRAFLWTDEDRIGRYVSSGTFYDPGLGYRGRVGGVFVCPEDDGGGRSYCMNLWASSASYYKGDPRYGYCFGGPAVRESSKTILVTEVFSVFPSPYGYLALSHGLGGTMDLSPGQRFGANNKYTSNWGHPGEVRYATTPTMITYMNHRRRSDGGVGQEAKGRLNIGYCDGHVAMKRDTELVDGSTGKSRFDSLWSPNDYAHEETIGPLK